MVNKTKQVKKLVTGGPMKRTVAGGLLGATAGWLASPKTAKKLIDRLGRVDLKEKGVFLGKATKEKLTEFRESGAAKTAHLLKSEGKNGQENDGESNGTSDEEQEGSGDYQALAEENKKLNDRLRLLEEKMENLNNVNDRKEENGKGRKQKKKKAEEEPVDEEVDDNETEDEEIDEDEKEEGKTKKKSSRAKNKKKTKGKKESEKTEGDEEDTTVSSDDDTVAS